VGGELTIQRLTEAYTHGIFPWFNEGDPVLWWSPDPRMVLPCAEFRASNSLRKRLRQLARDDANPSATWQIHINTAFADVIQACAEPRGSVAGTWISPQIRAAYQKWHQAGYVHSIETWKDGELVGGLYGVCLGRMFFGESMFARVPDASKLALAYLVTMLQNHGISHIDCQQQTAHLARLGARPIDRETFLDMVSAAQQHSTPHWPSGRLLSDGRLAALPPKTP